MGVEPFAILSTTAPVLSKLTTRASSPVYAARHKSSAGGTAPQHFLCFWAEPHGHGSFGLTRAGGACWSKMVKCFMLATLSHVITVSLLALISLAHASSQPLSTTARPRRCAFIYSCPLPPASLRPGGVGGRGGRLRLLCCLLCSACFAVCCYCACPVALALLLAVFV